MMTSVFGRRTAEGQQHQRDTMKSADQRKKLAGRASAVVSAVLARILQSQIERN